MPKIYNLNYYYGEKLSKKESFYFTKLREAIEGVRMLAEFKDCAQLKFITYAGEGINKDSKTFKFYIETANKKNQYLFDLHEIETEDGKVNFGFRIHIYYNKQGITKYFSNYDSMFDYMLLEADTGGTITMDSKYTKEETNIFQDSEKPVTSLSKLNVTVQNTKCKINHSSTVNSGLYSSANDIFGKIRELENKPKE